jgi:fumarate reductase flavoprotein subunit
VLFLVAALFAGCSPVVRGPVRKADLVDGVYRASHIQFPNRAVVEVTVKAQAIEAIRIVSHFAYKGTKAEKPIVERMLAAQSTQVDAVTGATNSSTCITKAVQRAIEKAYRE